MTGFVCLMTKILFPVTIFLLNSEGHYSFEIEKKQQFTKYILSSFLSDFLAFQLGSGLVFFFHTTDSNVLWV